MKKLNRIYQYEESYEVGDDRKIKIHKGKLKSCYEKRDYYTKMSVDDLPEYYCDVKRYVHKHDVISSKDVKALKYRWVKENHFMKDSVLYVSYTGNLEEYHDEYTIKGKHYVSPFISYKDTDHMVFEYSILKFLAYAHKYSKYDLSEIRSEFIEQCKWLEENEPPFAPDLNECSDYGEWFDNKIKEYI